MHPFALAMTLAQAIDFAMNHNATIAQQRALVSQAQSQYVRQRSQTLPGVLGQLQNQMQKSENYSNYSIIQGASQASVFSQNSVSLGTSYTFNGGLAFFQTLADKQQLGGKSRIPSPTPISNSPAKMKRCAWIKAICSINTFC
jgi:outer membrane protein TolC